MTRKADYATADIELRVAVRVWDDGRVEIVEANSHVIPPRLTRRWTKKEMAEDDQLTNEWWEGGAAILSPSHASNGGRLVARVQGVAGDLVTELRNIVREWS